MTNKELALQLWSDTKDIFFAGYGSLICPEGINGRGMVHRYEPGDLTEALLRGYKRSWSGLDPMGRLWYGVEKIEGEIAPVILFKVHSLRDLEALIRSELGDKCYQYDDISQNLAMLDGTPLNGIPAQIFCCVPKNPPAMELRVLKSVPDHYIPYCTKYLTKRSERFKQMFGKLEAGLVGF